MANLRYTVVVGGTDRVRRANEALQAATDEVRAAIRALTFRTERTDAKTDVAE